MAKITKLWPVLPVKGAGAGLMVERAGLMVAGVSYWELAPVR